MKEINSSVSTEGKINTPAKGLRRKTPLAAGLFASIAIPLAIACSSGERNTDFPGNVPISPTTVLEPSPTPISTPIPTPTEAVQSPENLSPEQRMLSYAKEVLKPGWGPDSLPDATTDLKQDQRFYRIKTTINSQTTVFQYYESTKSNNFTIDGLPLDMNITLVENGTTDITKDNLASHLAKYFINLPEIKPSDVKEFSVDRSPVMEVVWSNPDGTKESRSVLKFSQGVLYGACRLYKDSPLYTHDTCFDH